MDYAKHELLNALHVLKTLSRLLVESSTAVSQEDAAQALADAASDAVDILSAAHNIHVLVEDMLALVKIKYDVVVPHVKVQ